MRTTIRLDDDAFELARRVARMQRISLGKAISALVRKGSVARAEVRQERGLTVFDLPEDSPAVSMETVKRLESE